MAEDVTTLGKLIGPEKGRDAIHIAVAPVVAIQRMAPGTHIGLVPKSDPQAEYWAAPGAKPLIGIVDPFLPRPVEKGQLFYMLLYPNTIVGLRHVWAHPAFIGGDAYEAAVGEKELAMARMRVIAAAIGLDYEEVMSSIEEREFCFGDSGMPEDAREYAEEMTRLYAVIRGKVVDPDHITFRCTC